MMLPDDPWMQPTPKQFARAFTPFPRYTWIHPHVPSDNFDRVCKNIWSRAKEANSECGRGQSPPETPRNKVGTALDIKRRHRAEEQQKEADALGLSTTYEEDKRQYHTEFILPSPYLSGRRHPRVAKPARVPIPVMEAEMQLNENEAERKRNLDEEDPLLPSELPRDKCTSEDEGDISSSSDSSSTNDDFVSLPGVRSSATDISDDDSASDNNDCEVEENEIPHSSDESSSDSEQDSPSSTTEKDFPSLSTIRAGILPRPTQAPAPWKLHGRWEIPLSFHPHNIPTATLARGMTTPARAPVQGRAKAPQTSSKTNAPPAAATQQEAYDLLADFPALQPPKKPLAWGILQDGNPKTKDATRQGWLTHPPNHCQESGASHQRNMENVPHEVSSICAGDQKSVLNRQTFGSANQLNSPTISCGELKAYKQPPPRVAGADGVGVNARSWASAAKAGMKQAAAPQEKARPCTFQHRVAVNRAKAMYSVNQKCANRGTPSHQVANLWMTGLHRGPQIHHPNHCVRPGYHPNHQHSGAQAHRANCPPGFRCPRFPFQQRACGIEADGGRR